MQLTHEMAGLVIAILGALCVVMASPVPKQVTRWHLHAIEQVEPAMLAWLIRAVGIVMFILGLVTLANSA